MSCYLYNKMKSDNDDYYTPKSAWEMIQHLIPKDRVVWDPFYGDGQSGKDLKSLGFDVIHEDEDFFKHNKGDIIVTNPPFSTKKQILKRLVELDKPFILLCPGHLLSRKYFLIDFADKIQILIPPKRIEFTKPVEDPKNKSRCSFDCFFFCYKMNLEKDLMFLS